MTKLCVSLGCGFLLTFTAGCGPGTGAVTGTVTFKGQPLPAGSVMFFAADGSVERSQIAEDGSYSINRVRAGPVKIAVATRPPIRQTLRTPRQAPIIKGPESDAASPKVDVVEGKYVKIPAHYADADKSGLTYIVTRGPQTHDIELVP